MLSIIFHSYIQQTSNLCLYRIGSHVLSKNLTLPNVHTVSLIHCSRTGVNNLLTPERFPNLKTIHYLSAHPGQIDLYKRFSKPIEWVFPNRDYIFYNCMMEAGKGRVDNTIFHHYLHNVHVRPRGMEVELIIPGYGVYKGDYYHRQLVNYLERCYTPTSHILPHKNITNEVVGLPTDSISTFLREKMELDFYDEIMKDCMKEEKLLLHKKISLRETIGSI